MLEKDKFNRDTQRELTSSHSAKEKKNLPLEKFHEMEPRFCAVHI